MIPITRTLLGTHAAAALAAGLVLLPHAPLRAGEMDPAAALTSEAVASDDTLGLTLSTGYMSNYVFYGVDFGADSPWVGLDYAIGETPLTVGTWYVNPQDGISDDELDFYASLGGEVAGFDAAVTMSGYFYPSSGADANYELGVSLERGLGFLDWNANAIYDFVVGGSVIETGFSKTVSFTDAVELVLSGGIAYQIDYNSEGGTWNHSFAMLSLPIYLGEKVTLEPYVAGLFALEGVSDFQGDLLHGGVSLSVDF